MVRRAWWMITACAALTSAACATGTGVVGAVSIAEPGPVEGDETAIAWPFVVTHGGGPEILADFHLRIDDGGTLLAVRPDSQNPDPDARFVWRGEVRGDEGYWIGDVLPSGGQVRLVAMVRPEMDDGRILLRVVHWPTNGQDEAVGPETCEVWTYETDGQRLEQEEC